VRGALLGRTAARGKAVASSALGERWATGRGERAGPLVIWEARLLGAFLCNSLLGSQAWADRVAPGSHPSLGDPIWPGGESPTQGEIPGRICKRTNRC
jgi:hypothetical protein